MSIAEDQYQEIRDGVRAVCGQFPDEYHRLIDSKRTYPEEFVNALTAAGWLSAMIPEMQVLAMAKCTTWARYCVMVPTNRKSNTYLQLRAVI